MTRRSSSVLGGLLIAGLLTLLAATPAVAQQSLGTAQQPAAPADPSTAPVANPSPVPRAGAANQSPSPGQPALPAQSTRPGRPAPAAASDWTIPGEQIASQVRFLGETVIPTGLSVAGTTVGGLSGIDRDAESDQYVLISDDRSDRQAARFYQARINVDDSGLHGIEFTGSHPFRRADGSTYPTSSDPDGGAVDPEDIRVDPWSGHYWWSQEGHRPDNPVGDTTLAEPSIRVAAPDGEFVGALRVPANYGVTTPGQGTRNNESVEAITFAQAGSLLVSALEGPLLQDGPPASSQEGALSRITVQTRAGQLLAQYPYQQEPLFTEPEPDGRAATSTGVTAILAAEPVNANQHLVLERTFVAGSGYKVRLFLIDTEGATNIKDLPSMTGNQVTPVRKRLLLDFDDLPLCGTENPDRVARRALERAEARAAEHAAGQALERAMAQLVDRDRTGTDAVARTRVETRTEPTAEVDVRATAAAAEQAGKAEARPCEGGRAVDPVQNFEGMTWGPRLSSGERVLLLVSDDDFAPDHASKLVALAVR
ncbi:esterase-like activity of phytase family protein [Goodfellowiella coeruleoviolacea]|uniref:Phytase-like domain-containing protein n=1 Tax=Goodfellowiella coeruleoviolacea TaxID=334858 RepID=A0AAE3GKB5_9PSEU|nr:esterase-like activity of phytase family protein [Goodfellowiella coeruleoviolacea]MCP2168944.1 hypothetical protein [Goodfellowiella coeruleoviolacea]